MLPWPSALVEFVCSPLRSNWPQVLWQFPGVVTWRCGRNLGHAVRWALETSPPSWCLGIEGQAWILGVYKPKQNPPGFGLRASLVLFLLCLNNSLLIKQTKSFRIIANGNDWGEQLFDGRIAVFLSLPEPQLIQVNCLGQTQCWHVSK